MTIAILINGNSAINQAGTRIRYKRLVELNGLLDQNIKIVATIEEVLIIKDLKMLVIGKVINSLAIIIAKIISEKNILVGIDIFDDYYSNCLSITSYQRYWLSVIDQYVSFYLCSTERMLEVLDVLTSKPIYVLEDPLSKAFSSAKLKQLLQKKQDILANTNTLTITWFGIGDNPIFPVGIEDLHAWFNALVELKSTDRNIQLNVLTNKRALTTNRLLLLGQCPIPFKLEEWNEELEDKLLEKTDIAFLPVNYQNFSIAKSPNRALTALIHGCQVLSPGFNLYQNLNDYIYTSSRSLAFDIARQSYIFNLSNLNTFTDTVTARFDPIKGLLLLDKISNNDLLLCNKSIDCNTQNYTILISGINPIDISGALREIDSIIVTALPFKKNDHELYDIYFTHETSGCYLRIRKSLTTLFPNPLDSICEASSLAIDSNYLSIGANDLERLGILNPVELSIMQISLSWDDMDFHVLNYDAMLTLMSKIIRILFSDFTIILNEKPGSYWVQ